MNSLERKWDEKYKVGPNARVLKCTCNDPGTITIDPDSTNLLCGIVGVVSIENTRLHMVGKTPNVSCGNCGKTIEIK